MRRGDGPGLEFAGVRIEAGRQLIDIRTQRAALLLQLGCEDTSVRDATEVLDEANLFEGPDDPLRRVELPSLHAITVVVLELVVVVMVTLAEGEQSHGARVASAVGGRIRATANHVAERVDAEGALLDHDRTEQSSDEEGGQGSHPRGFVAVEVTPRPAQEGRGDETDGETDPLDVAVLPHHERVSLEILDVSDGRLWLQTEE